MHVAAPFRSTYLVMELFDFPNFSTLLADRELTTLQKLHIAEDIACGVSFLHQHNA